MKDSRGIVSVLLMSVLVLRPHLSGGTYPFAQELLLIPVLVGLGLLFLVPQGVALRRKDLRLLTLPWLLVLWSLTSLLWCPDPGQGTRDSASLALNVSAFTAVYLLGADRERLGKGLSWFSILVLLPVLASALYQRAFGFSRLRALLAGMSAVGQDVSGLMGVISRERVFGGFLSPNMLAGFLALAVPLTLDRALTASRRRDTALLSCLLLLEGVVLLLTGSMGGTLAALLAAGGVVLVRRGAGRRAIFGMAAAAAVLALGLLSIRGAGPILGPENSLFQRAGYVAAGLRMAGEHPLLGWGAGSSPGALMGFVQAGIRPVTDPHNFLVRIWIELGITGLAVFGLFAGLAAGNILGKARQGGLKAAESGYAGFLFAVAAFLLHSLMDMDFHVPETALFGWCAAGGLLALSAGEGIGKKGGEVSLPVRQVAGGIALFAVLPALVVLQGESLAFRAMKEGHAGRPGAAASLYREAGKLMPFNGRVLLEEGRARLQAGEREQAIALFRKADHLMAHSPYPPWDLGRAYQAQGAWAQSVDHLERARSRYPTSPRILVDLARSHLNLGDRASAASRLEDALAVSMFDPMAGELARDLMTGIR